MERNKTGKYLKYAIGEIVLVMIGILLALQVNNWNEKRKANNIEQEIMNQILNDLQSEVISLNQILQNHNAYIEYLSKVSERKYDEVNLDHLLLNLIWSFSYSSRPKGFHNLMEHSKSAIISNNALFDALRVHYEDEHQLLNKNSEWHVNFTTNTVEDYVVKNLPVNQNYLTNGDDMKKELNNTNLMSIVNYQLSSVRFINQTLNAVIKNSESLIGELKDTLKLMND